MKNKISLLFVIVLGMAPISIFAIIQLIKAFQNSPWLSILAFACILGTWALVIKAFAFRNNGDTQKTSLK